jgi:hypothetical protein
MRIPLDLPVGLNGDDTSFAAAGRYADCSNIRWRNGKAQVRGGCEALVSTRLTGVCRGVFAWTDLSAVLDIAFGTHTNLQLWQGGVLFDITPGLALPAQGLGANPLAVTSGSPVVTVIQNGHPHTTGDSVVVAGAAAVGGITPNGTFAVTVVSANSWTYVLGANATATAAGGGAAVVITPQKAFAAGAVDGTGGAGYGTGAFSTGTYSAPSTADFFPRTWAFAAWGENLMASPRSGAIYGWTNNTATPAAPLLNSPAKVTHMLVATQDQVFALGCNQEVSGVFNPLCIRHSGIRANTVWNTDPSTTAQEYVLPGGGRIVAGRVIGASLLVWTNVSLFLGTYVGSPNQVWRFDKVGDKCGLIGPNAAVVVGQRAFWIGPDLQFYSYGLGGQAQAIDCPIRDAFAANLATGQGDKIQASSASSFQEIRFDYPDARDGTENSRYLSLIISGADAGAWARGVEARTAYVDAGPASYPIAADPGGRALWQERGMSDDGGPLAWFLETADQNLSIDQTTLVRGLWPDLADQVGPVNLTIFTRLKPESPETANGPYAVAAGQDRVDVRASGRLFRIRYEGDSARAACRWGSPVFDVVQTGGR